MQDLNLMTECCLTWECRNQEQIQDLSSAESTFMRAANDDNILIYKHRPKCDMFGPTKKI